MAARTDRLLPTASAVVPDPLAGAKRKLLIGTALCFLFMLAEVVGGMLAHSLAVMTDAAHMLSDVAGFVVSVLALILSSRQATPEYSFGYSRAEVLGALASIMVVWMMTGILLWEAVMRFITPEIVDGKVMFWVSVIGIAMNLVLMRVLSGDGEDGHLHGHSHSHGHSHAHAHAHKPKKPKPKAYVPPPAAPSHAHGHGHGESRHGHDDEHGADCCEHGHKEAHGHGHEEAHVHAHGHEHVEAHGHDEEHGAGCCGRDDGGSGHGHGQGSHEHGHSGHEAHDEEGDAHADDDNLAVRAAMAHVIGDILQSVGVTISAALIWAFSDRWLDADGISYWYRTDPICTVVFSVLVMWSTMGTVTEAMRVLMAGTPYGADTAELLEQFKGIPQVLDVHDLHVWTLVGNKINVWAHLTVESGADHTQVLYAAQRVARSINCHHTCFQLEDVVTYDRRVEGDGCFEAPTLRL